MLLRWIRSIFGKPKPALPPVILPAYHDCTLCGMGFGPCIRCGRDFR